MNVSSSSGFSLGREVEKYFGPKDGQSHPSRLAQRLIRPIAHGFLNACYRIEVEGEENFPHEGKHVYTPTHPSVFDPPMISTLTKRDMRYMADIGLFGSKAGAKFLTWAGAFPVNRRDVSRVTLEHSVDVVKDGRGFCIFPEGGMPVEERDGQVGPLKRGAAAAAIRGGAESIVPILIHYEKNKEKRVGPMVVAGVVAAGICTASILGTMFGGPLVKTVVATASGALTGAYVTGKTLRAKVKNEKWFNPSKRMIAGLFGGLLGGIVGAVGGNAISDHLSRGMGVGLAAAGGVSAFGIGSSFVNRDVCRMVIGQPMLVEPYMARYPVRRECVTAITEDLHRTLGAMKAEATGIPYDDTKPKIRWHGWCPHGEDWHGNVCVVPQESTVARKAVAEGELPPASGGLS